MEFVKMHGLGNDFIIVPEGQADLPAGQYADAARRLCAPTGESARTAWS